MSVAYSLLLPTHAVSSLYISQAEGRIARRGRRGGGGREGGEGRGPSEEGTSLSEIDERRRVDGGGDRDRGTGGVPANRATFLQAGGTRR